MGNNYFEEAVRIMQKVRSDPELTTENLLEKMCGEAGVDVGEVLKKTKHRHLASLRHAAQYLMQDRFGHTCKYIASITGNLDHSSVVYGTQKVRDYLQNNKIKL